MTSICFNSQHVEYNLLHDLNVWYRKCSQCQTDYDGGTIFLVTLEMISVKLCTVLYLKIMLIKRSWVRSNDLSECVC